MDERSVDLYAGNSVGYWRDKALAYKSVVGQVWGALESIGIRADGSTSVVEAVKRLAQPAASDQDRQDMETGRKWREDSSLEAWFPLTAEELESTKRMFHAAISDLAAISERLGVDPDDGGAEPILSAIDELAAQKADDADPLQGAADWLVKSLAKPRPTEIAARLLIGYNRAERLFDAAIAQQRQGEGGE